MKNYYKSASITLMYLFLGMAWILITDFLVNDQVKDLSDMMQTMKGLLYIFITGVLLYIALRKWERKLDNQNTQFEILFDSNIIPMIVFNPEKLNILKANTAAKQKFDVKGNIEENSINNIIPSLAIYIGEEYSILSTIGVQFKHSQNNDTYDFIAHSKEIQQNGQKAILLSFTDITDIARAKNNISNLLFESENLRKALDNSTMIAYVDLNGHIIYANQKFFETTKYNEEEIIGVNFYKLQSQLENLDIYKELVNVIIFGKAWEGEIELQAKDGSNFWINLVINPIYNNERKIEKFLCICYEITNTKTMEIQLRKLNQELEGYVLDRTRKLSELVKDKDEFLGIAAHDLKNPLTAILINSDIVINHFDKLGKDETIKRMKEVEKLSKKMFDIINNMLELNRFESINLTPHYELIQLHNITESVFNNHYENATKKGITFSFETSEDEFYSDSVILTQILDNLVSNAIKFCYRGDKIIIRSKVYDSFDFKEVVFEIEDNGPGIPDKDKDKLFTRFVKLTNKPTAGEDTSGLGLAIVRKLTEMMNGKAWCQSEIGVGSTFFVSFPVEHRDNVMN